MPLIYGSRENARFMYLLFHSVYSICGLGWNTYITSNIKHITCYYYTPLNIICILNVTYIYIYNTYIHINTHYIIASQRQNKETIRFWEWFLVTAKILGPHYLDQCSTLILSLFSLDDSCRPSSPCENSSPSAGTTWKTQAISCIYFTEVSASLRQSHPNAMEDKDHGLGLGPLWQELSVHNCYSLLHCSPWRCLHFNVKTNVWQRWHRTQPSTCSTWEWKMLNTDWWGTSG